VQLDGTKTCPRSVLTSAPPGPATSRAAPLGRLGPRELRPTAIPDQRSLGVSGVAAERDDPPAAERQWEASGPRSVVLDSGARGFVSYGRLSVMTKVITQYRTPRAA
jgi:hypothetical protein